MFGMFFSRLFRRLSEQQKKSQSHFRQPRGQSVTAQSVLPKALLVGHSHVVAVRMALMPNGHPNERLDICAIHRENLKPEVTSTPDGPVLHPGLRARIDQDRYDFAFLSIGGGPHIIMGLVKNPATFDFVLPYEPDLPIVEGAQVLPYDAVLETLRRRNAHNRNIFAAVSDHFRKPLFHLDYPPPVPDGWARDNGGPFADKIDVQGVSPLSVRYKLWRANLQVLDEMCTAHGIERIGVPPSMLASDGTLADEGLFKDPIHGNRAYGHEVAQQIFSIMNRGKISREPTARNILRQETAG